jgi:hypothetical protein
MAPKASRVAVLYNPADRSNVLVLKELRESAPALSLALQPLEVQGPGEFEGAFIAMIWHSDRASRRDHPVNAAGIEVALTHFPAEAGHRRRVAARCSSLLLLHAVAAPAGRLRAAVR